MDKTLLKQGGKFLFYHLLMTILAFAIYYVFGWFFDRAGLFRYSLVCSVIYFYCIYTEAWKWGEKEAKHYSKVEPTPVRALIASAIPFAVCVFFLLAFISNYKVIIMNFFTLAWYMPFMGFFDRTEFVTYGELLFDGLTMPALMTLGYYSGMKGFSLRENLVSKDSKKKFLSIGILGTMAVLVVVLGLTISGHKTALDNNHWALRNHTLTESIEKIKSDEIKFGNSSEGVLSEDKTVLTYDLVSCIAYDCSLEFTDKNDKITMKYTFPDNIDNLTLANELKGKLGEPKTESDKKIEWSAEGYLYIFDMSNAAATLKISVE